MWYSSQIPLSTRNKSDDLYSDSEYASKSRESILHKARFSELQTRQRNDGMKSFIDEDYDHDYEKTKSKSKVLKLGFLILFAVITVLTISGKHLFPEQLTDFSKILKMIEVEAFEVKKVKSVIGNEEKEGSANKNETAVSVSNKNNSTPYAKYSRSLVLLDLEDWRKNWSSRNLKGFMAYYHPEFPDLQVFKNNKERIFKKTKFIKISLKNIVSRAEGNNIYTSFTQTYRSKSYNDKSIKELKWSKTELGWKIIEEKNISSNVAKQGKE